MSKRSIRKIRHIQPSPSFKDCVAAGQNGSISLLWQECGFPERKLTLKQKEKLNSAIQNMIDKVEQPHVVE
jgi:hypothetical protein